MTDENITPPNSNENVDPSNITPASPPPPPPLFGETPPTPQTPQPHQEPIAPTVIPAVPVTPPPPYGAPAQGTYYSNTAGYNIGGAKNDPFSITALSTGIPAIILSCCCGLLGGILGIIATVFGFLSLGRINKSHGQLVGKGMAIGGLTCGILGIVIGFGLLFLNLVFGFNDFGSYGQ